MCDRSFQRFGIEALLQEGAVPPKVPSNIVTDKIAFKAAAKPNSVWRTTNLADEKGESCLGD